MQGTLVVRLNSFKETETSRHGPTCKLPPSSRITKLNLIFFIHFSLDCLPVGVKLRYVFRGFFFLVLIVYLLSVRIGIER